MIYRYFTVFLFLCSLHCFAQKVLPTNQINKTSFQIPAKTENSAAAKISAEQVTVDFEKKVFMVTETTSNTDGCRGYKDYTLQMVLSGQPSAAGTAILSFAGTASKGQDYEVTTNQNFSTPSTTLTFPSTSSNPVAFTVRIYDDTTPEDTETIVISYLLNNNGGNLINGQTALTLTIKIQDNDLAPYLANSGTKTIGANSTLEYLGDSDPLDARSLKRKVYLAYTGEELRNAGVLPGNLTSLAFFVLEKKSSRAFKNLTIKLVNAQADHLLDNSNFYTFSAPATVYTASQYSTTTSWNTFTFSTPFAWTGGNLGIEICYDNSTADATQGLDKFAAYTDHPNPGNAPQEWNLLIFEDLNCAASPTLSLTPDVYPDRYRPQIRLSYASSGVAVETASNSTSTNQIVAGSNDYFYSNGKIVGNLSASSAKLGCVTFAVEESGTNWVTTNENATRSAKVFQVTPSEGMAGTSYTISFFITSEELGGRSANSLKLAKTTAGSASSASSGNTVLVNPTVATFGTNAYLFTASFTGFSRFFLVQENALPVTLIDLKATAQEQKTIALEWTTSLESNFDRFEVEHSLSPKTNFQRLSTVSGGQQAYGYKHLQPAVGSTNYYRLKIIDKDGTFAYSKLVSALVKGENDLAVSPNPAREKILLTSSSGITTVRLVSMDGRVVLEKIYSGNNSQEVTLPKVASGLYFLKITTRAGTTEHKKLLIE